MNIKNLEISPLAPGLYLLATPIGNLRDITLRALDSLAAADLVVCEDTRITGKLLQAHGISARMFPYNDHNASRQRPKILEALGNNQSVVFCSDAGTPLVSDPGFKLVRDCLDLGLMVTTVPGPSAPLSALQLSGLPSDRFAFLGFCPAKSEARRGFLQEWQGLPLTLVFFETAPRLSDSLADMAEIFGDRAAAVVREITKRFEEARRGSLTALADFYAGNPPKGEIVVVVEGASETVLEDDAIADQLVTALDTMSVKDAAAFVAEATGQGRKKIYQMALALKSQEGR